MRRVSAGVASVGVLLFDDVPAMVKELSSIKELNRIDEYFRE